jgi:hypothetical protein
LKTEKIPKPRETMVLNNDTKYISKPLESALSYPLGTPLKITLSISVENRMIRKIVEHHASAVMDLIPRFIFR